MCVIQPFSLFPVILRAQKSRWARPDSFCRMYTWKYFWAVVWPLVRPQTRVYICFICPGALRSFKKTKQVAFFNHLGKLTARVPRLIYHNVFYSGRLKKRKFPAAKNPHVPQPQLPRLIARFEVHLLTVVREVPSRHVSVRSASWRLIASIVLSRHVTSLFMSTPLILGQQVGIKPRTWRCFSFSSLGRSVEVTRGWGMISHVS